MKRLTNMKYKAAVLAMTLVCGIAAICGTGTNVLADEKNSMIDDSKKGSITIHKYDISSAQEDGKDESFQATGEKNTDAEDYYSDYAIEGVEFTYLRVSDTKQYEHDNVVMLIYQIDDDLQDILGITEEDAVLKEGDALWFRGETISNGLLNALKENTKTKDALEAYVADGTQMPFTDEDGLTEAEDLQTGLYLIVETKVPEKVSYTTDPWFVQLPMTTNGGDSWFYDVDCYPKNQTNEPTLEKLVKEDDAETYDESTYGSEGDVIDYIIVSKLPHITSKSTALTEYTFRDTLSPGLSYQKDAEIVFYNNEEDARSDSGKEGKLIALWSDQSGCFTVDYEEADNGSTEMTVAMTATGLKEINEAYSDMYMVIRYTAVLHADESCVVGKKGNPNEVVLIYKRTSTDYYDQLKDDCTVYTLALIVEKTFEGSFDSDDVAQVRFTLYNETDHCYVTDVSEKSSNGNYYISAMGKSDPYEFSLCADEKADEYRMLTVTGLEKDDWKLVETKTATGFSLLKSDVDVDLSGDVPDDGIVEYQVLNKKSFTLPQTGGAGLYLVTIVGVLVATLGCLLFTRKSKTNEER